MGSGRYSTDDWVSYSHTMGRSADPIRGVDPSVHHSTIFTASRLDPDLDPKGKTRESVDSADNPQSTPLIVGLDVSGSMGMISGVMARVGLKTLMTEVYDRRPITDPHLMFMGIGDAEMRDTAPLQVTQFEADVRIAKQLDKLYLEGGGGGNQHESYMLPWYFAAHHTKIDSFDKRGKRGYLFTIGDEYPQMVLPADCVRTVIGDSLQSDISVEELLTQVSRQWDIFHVIVAEGSHARGHERQTRDQWTKLLGQQAIWLTDHTKLAEVIVSIMQIREGLDHHTVAGSWDGTTAVTVRAATAGLTTSAKSGDLVTL